MTLSDMIRTRFSVNTFDRTRQVPPDDIIALLDTAVWAPNHRNTEPWRFILLTDEARALYIETRRRMAVESSPAQDEHSQNLAGDGMVKKLGGVPSFLIIAMRNSPKPDVREEDYAATSALIQNFLLLAHEAGLGAVWKTWKDDPRLRALARLENDETVVGVLHVGYPAEDAPARSRVAARERFTHITGQ
ncbi:MAG: nitroreductase [Pleurocapsa minor GSE-CHR-MK-17-07R]|jgi:nitroreductase|nr:nitroreductase [Pleurocapsa minor GSE-CHR-MK 17-07R]